MTLAIKWLCGLGQKIFICIMQMLCIQYVLIYS